MNRDLAADYNAIVLSQTDRRDLGPMAGGMGRFAVYGGQWVRVPVGFCAPDADHDCIPEGEVRRAFHFSTDPQIH